MLAFLLTVAVAVISDTAWFAIFRAKSVGKFKVIRDAGNSFSFASGTGTFTANQAIGLLTYAQGRQRGTLPFAEIKGLEYRVNERYALLEELFFGFDMTDLLAAYQDTVEWFSIAAVATDGRRIPLYLSGQHQRREFFAGWYIDLQIEMLKRLGLLTDVEEQSKAALDLVQARLGGARLL